MKTTFRSIGIGFLLSAIIVTAMIFVKPHLPASITNMMAQDAVASKEYDNLKAEFEQYKADKEKEIEDLKKEQMKNDKKDSTKESKNENSADSSEKESSEGESTLVINPGESSYDVSSRLANMGLIDSQADFSAYLTENGYDVNIQPGEYQLSPGMTYSQIAQIIAIK
ncbi:endolytic transglycosylase MltG [Atopobacter phocae]|uniref:endolytic transglycosylase MltG n=1 Tax=Atopobacter phocae TaxID=136492 RepID=UPI000472E373|nr:endolytic transglycosylase MltG [Atopobacter phocae]